MIPSAIVMIQKTVALLFAAILSISGLTRDVEIRSDALVVPIRFAPSCAFGGIAFVTDSLLTTDLVNHEIGHIRQEAILGVFYLPLIALPSITWNLLTRADVLQSDTYYDRWPENWADELGGVKR